MKRILPLVLVLFVVQPHTDVQFAYIDDDQPMMFCCIEERADRTSYYVKNPGDWTIAQHQYCSGVLDRWRAEVSG